MRYFKTIITIGLLSLSLQAQQTRCFSYNTKEFILKQVIYNKDKDVVKKFKVDKVKIYYFKDSSNIKPITLEYSVNSHTRYYKYIFCNNKENGNKWCGIECDGGGFNLKKDYSIQVKYPLRVSGESPDTPEPLIYLEQNSKKYIKSNEFKCPSKLPRPTKDIDEKFYKDNPNGKSVCYDYKYKNKYIGCFRALKPCKYLHLQHFGKYSTKEESKKALTRCKNSTPNSKFADNPKGLYVCYDYLDEDGLYSGCFRSLSSCKLKNKKHFGRYTTTLESKKALFRCISSIPRIK